MLSIDALSIERLRQIVRQQIEAGLLDPVTFAARATIDEKVEVLGTKASGWKRCRIRNHVFDMPDSMVNPVFLGAGGYGCVAECWYKGQKVAVKKVAVPGKSNADDTIRLLREVMILKKAQEEQQESVCQVLDIYANASCTGPKDLKQIYMVMPLYSPGCLEDVTVTSPEMFKSIASQTLHALNWLHGHGILHRDIKRENVFYDAASNRAVLGDMGNARLRSIAKMTGKNEVGTKCYQAPEFMASQAYSFSSDIWALAVCWYEMLCLENGQDTMFPLVGTLDVERLNKQRALCQLVNPTHKYRVVSAPENKKWALMTWNRVEEMELQWNETAYSRILRSMFAFDKKRRPTTLDIFGDPFFAGSKPDVRVGPIFEDLDVTDYKVAKSLLYDLPTIRPPVTASASKDSGEGGAHNTSSTACPSETASASKDSGKSGAHTTSSTACPSETAYASKDSGKDEACAEARYTSPVPAPVPVAPSFHASMHLTPATDPDSSNWSPVVRSVDSNTTRLSISNDRGNTCHQLTDLAIELVSLLDPLSTSSPLDMRSRSAAPTMANTPCYPHFYSYWTENTLTEARECSFAANARDNDRILSKKRALYDEGAESPARGPKVRRSEACSL